MGGGQDRAILGPQEQTLFPSARCNSAEW
jgi:hypothetical protein